MKRLFEINLHDYGINDKVFRRPSARGIIFDGRGRLALVYSRKEKFYKFPGGGIQDDEDKKQALIREVREETGLVVVPESIEEFGSVLRRQKDDKKPGVIFEQENFYYLCKVENKIVGQNLDDYEAEYEFVLEYVTLDHAIDVNSSYKTENHFNEIMIKRETQLLKLMKEKGLKNDADKIC